MGPKGLNAQWTRLTVHWATLQPGAPGTTADRYDPTYLAQLDTVIGALHGAGITVILTMQDVPRWASDSSLWHSPPPGSPKGYAPSFAIDTRSAVAMTAFHDLGTFLAGRYGQAQFGVHHFECWNEPNLGLFLYPQRTAGSPRRGMLVYLAMLKEFSTGVRASGVPGTVVIAGATAPTGVNLAGNTYSSTPQSFALYLKAQAAGKYFDAYSHHPYTPGGSIHHAPDQPPNDATRTVTLYDLGQLLRVFPTKPFYLTEYGYSTEYSRIFGLTITEAQQAQYLRTAYSYVRRYKQVKALIWYTLQDWGNARTGVGVFTGLDTVSGAHKPSWNAFRALP